MMERRASGDKFENPGMLDFVPFQQQTESTQEDHSENSKTFRCTYSGCMKNFRYRSELLRHEDTHTNNRPYVCPFSDCCKAFKRPDVLTTHFRVHTGDKPFECPVGSCKQAFKTKPGLRYHILKHKNNKLYRCNHPGCEQSFLTMSQLKQHKRAAKVHEILQISKGQSSPKIPLGAEMTDNLGVTSSAQKFYSAVMEYEPVIQKRLHVVSSPSSREHIKITNCSNEPSLLKFNRVASILEKANSNPKSNLCLPLKVLPNDLCEEGNFFSKSCLSHSRDLEEQSTQADSISRVNAVFVSEDHTKLLKIISTVLDENTVLKKHLEISRKIISLYQSSFGGSNKSPSC